VQTPDCEPVPLRYPNDTQELYSGDILDIPLTTNWNYNGQVIISGNGAVPMHITTIMPQVNVGGK
jgi:hypothetical protein